MGITVTYDGQGLYRMLRAAETLASPARMERLLRDGMLGAGRATLTQVRSALHAQMGTKRKTLIFRDTRGFVKAGWAEGLAYTIEGRGKGLPINEFRVSGSRQKGRTWRDQPRNALGRFGPLPPSDKGFVTGYPWNVAHNFKRSFVAADGKFKARLPGGGVRLLYGPAVAKEIVQGATLARFMSESTVQMHRHIGRRLQRLLP